MVGPAHGLETIYYIGGVMAGGNEVATSLKLKSDVSGWDKVPEMDLGYDDVKYVTLYVYF